MLHEMLTHCRATVRCDLSCFYFLFFFLFLPAAYLLRASIAPQKGTNILVKKVSSRQTAIKKEGNGVIERKWHERVHLWDHQWALSTQAHPSAALSSQRTHLSRWKREPLWGGAPALSLHPASSNWKTSESGRGLEEWGRGWDEWV